MLTSNDGDFMSKFAFIMSVAALISCGNDSTKQQKINTEILEETTLQQALGDKDFYVELNFIKGSFLHGEIVQVANNLCDDGLIAILIKKDKNIGLHCANDPYRSIDISYKSTKQGNGYVLNLEEFKFDNIPEKGKVDNQEISLEKVLKSWRWYLNTDDKTIETIATHIPEHLKDVQIDYNEKTITCMKDGKKQTLSIKDAASCSLLIGYIKSSSSES